VAIDGAARFGDAGLSRHEDVGVTQYLFKAFSMLDPEHDELRDGHELLVEGDRIKEISSKPIKAPNATVIDCGKRTLMPGLIDSHVHVVLSEVSIPRLEHVPLTLMTARAAVLMRAMLDRGFTSVRDTGGADWGLKEATEKWLLPGPRLFIAGKALGPTGGHSDSRRRTDHATRCHCCDALHFAMGLADGVAEVRKAVREEMRQGCDQVKIMMSGGVASPYDPLDSLQFSPEEVAAAVEEAHAFGRYVCAHAYSAEAISRAAHAGVRTIEHGNLIDEASAKLMASKGMFLIANLVTYYEMKNRAAEYGMSSDMLAKNDLVIEGGLRSLEICKRAGVPVAYGTDLLGQLQSEQSREFLIRWEVQKPIEIIRAATLIGAQILRQVDKLGCLKPGAFADLLVVEGNPLADLGVLQEQGKHLAVIMKGGRFHKHRLH
jgi:imidazolonepropionase-like amidohydrolase